MLLIKHRHHFPSPGQQTLPWLVISDQRLGNKGLFAG